MSRTPTDWAVWLPKAFFLNWSDKESRERNMNDPTIWLPLGLFPPVERERLVNNYYNYYGDMFENINNSTITNKSIVERSFNKINMEYGQDIGSALQQINEFIRNSGNIAAAALYDKFNEELTKSQPEKPILGKIWSGIETLFPEISRKSDQVAKISALFH